MNDADLYGQDIDPFSNVTTTTQETHINNHHIDSSNPFLDPTNQTIIHNPTSPTDQAQNPVNLFDSQTSMDTSSVLIPQVNTSPRPALNQNAHNPHNSGQSTTPTPVSNNQPISLGPKISDIVREIENIDFQSNLENTTPKTITQPQHAQTSSAQTTNTNTITIDQFLSRDPIVNLHRDPSLNLSGTIDFHANYTKFITALDKNQLNSPTPSIPPIPSSNKDPSTGSSSDKDPPSGSSSVKDPPSGSHTNSNPSTLQDPPTKPRILEPVDKLVNDLRSANSKRLEFETKAILFMQYKRNGVYPRWSVNTYSPELLMNTQQLVHQFVEFRKKQAEDLLQYTADVYKTHAETKRNDAKWLTRRITEHYQNLSGDDYNLPALWTWVDHLATKDRRHHERNNQLEYNTVAQYPLQYIWEGVDRRKFTVPSQAIAPPKSNKSSADRAMFGDQEPFQEPPQVRRGARPRSRTPAAKNRRAQAQPPSTNVQPLMAMQVAPPRRPNTQQRKYKPQPRNNQAQPQQQAQTYSVQDPSSLRLLEQNVQISSNILTTMTAINKNLEKLNN